MNTNNNLFSNVNWKNFAAGVAGGACSTALFHPLELIKIRWQVYESASLKKLKILSNSNPNSAAPSYRPNYKSLLDTASQVFKTEHGIRGLYRGLMINVIASGSAWGIYFLIYNTLKNRHLKENKLHLANYTLDATIAGVTTIFITNPLFLIKTRMCLQYNEQAVSKTNVKYKNSWQAFKVLLKTDGFLGMYKGIIPGLFGTLNGTIQMVTYDLMKSWWIDHLKKKNESHKLDSSHYSLFSSLSKILAVACTFPFQLVRTRLQDQHQDYKNLTDVVIKTYKNEKIYGFYKGLLPCLLRVTPAAALTFIVYENLLEFLA